MELSKRRLNDFSSRYKSNGTDVVLHKAELIGQRRFYNAFKIEAHYNDEEDTSRRDLYMAVCKDESFGAIGKTLKETIKLLENVMLNYEKETDSHENSH